MSNVKILVCGDVEGNFSILFSKVAAIHKKRGPFEYLLCVGNFFGTNNAEWMAVKDGRIKVPLTTYILGPNAKDFCPYYPDSLPELAPDIIYLGKQGQLTGSSGLKIAYLSGIEGNQSSKYSFSKKDVTELTNSITDPVDILLTSQWPRGVTKYAKPLENSDASVTGSTSIAYVAKHLKPRYHFSGLSGVHYERLPYRNHQVLQETSIHSTRFIGLAPVLNDKKLKWLYAFNINPFSTANSKELTEIAGPVTECPYNEEEYQEQFFYDMNTSGSSKRTRNGDEQSAKRRLHNPVTQDKCWFCLENPNFEKQLVLSIGDHNYLTLAKGGMVKDHILIIPIEHVQSSIKLSPEEDKEFINYKKALVSYFHENGKDVVFFERSLASPHLQCQVVPIPKSKTSEIKENIMDIASTNGIELHELSKYSQVHQLVPPKKNFFYVEIWIDTKQEGKLLHVIEGKFPLQFGRMMLACKDILNIPESIDWKQCQMDPAEELEEVACFKENFKRYDFKK